MYVNMYIVVIVHTIIIINLHQASVLINSKVHLNWKKLAEV